MKAVIFDLDGTIYRKSRFAMRLILGDPRHVPVLRRERKYRKKLQGRFFPSEEAFYDELFSLMAGGSPEKALKCRRWFWERFMPLQVRIIGRYMKPRRNLAEVVASLKAAGCRVAVLSDYGMALQKLQVCGYDAGMFDKVWESPSIGGLKPCRETFLRACKELGVGPDEALMVGDKTDSDGGAVDAGLRFIRIKDRPSGADDMTWEDFSQAVLGGKLF